MVLGITGSELSSMVMESGREGEEEGGDDEEEEEGEEGDEEERSE